MLIHFVLDFLTTTLDAYRDYPQKMLDASFIPLKPRSPGQVRVSNNPIGILMMTSL